MTNDGFKSQESDKHNINSILQKSSSELDDPSPGLSRALSMEAPSQLHSPTDAFSGKTRMHIMGGHGRNREC